MAGPSVAPPPRVSMLQASNARLRAQKSKCAQGRFASLKAPGRRDYGQEPFTFLTGGIPKRSHD